MQAIGFLSRREYSRQELRQKLLASLRERGRQLARRRAATARELARRCANSRRTASDDAFAPPDLPSRRRRTQGYAKPALPDHRKRRELRYIEIEAAVDQLLDWLVANKYLSEARFIESRVALAQKDTLLIKLELARHGLVATRPPRCRAKFAQAQTLWQRKFGELAPDAPASRSRPVSWPRLRGGRRAPRRRGRRRVLTTSGAASDADRPLADAPAARGKAGAPRHGAVHHDKVQVHIGFPSLRVRDPPGCSKPSQNLPLA